jgi:hypothetical protein
MNSPLYELGDWVVATKKTIGIRFEGCSAYKEQQLVQGYMIIDRIDSKSYPNKHIYSCNSCSFNEDDIYLYPVTNRELIHLLKR